MSWRLVRICCWVSLLAALAVTAWVYFMSGPSRVITAEDYRQIHIGMTADQAEKIIGCPPGKYGSGNALATDSEELQFPGVAPDGRTIYWMGQRGGIVLRLDAKGVVQAKRFVRMDTR